MARFKPASEIQNNQINQEVQKQEIQQQKRYPFKNLYGCAEGNMVYVNMEAVDTMNQHMTTLRDIALIIDISGSMSKYYKDGSVERMCRTIVDTLASFDDDGIDLMFFANGLVHRSIVRNAQEVKAAIDQALVSKGAFGSTMPTEAFKTFCEQIKQKGRAGTVLFLTDGAMDDGGRELKRFYTDYLHTQFKTRDNFYCYAIEFGHMASGALDVLDGLYKPEQGPEDLFDLDSSDNLDKIVEVLTQVAGMSAVGSDNITITASVDNGAKIDMVNADLIEGGMDTIQGGINKIMSFRLLTDKECTLRISVQGYDPMVIKVIPKGIDVDLQLL